MDPRKTEQASKTKAELAQAILAVVEAVEKHETHRQGAGQVIYPSMVESSRVFDALYEAGIGPEELKELKRDAVVQDRDVVEDKG